MVQALTRISQMIRALVAGPGGTITVAVVEVVEIASRATSASLHCHETELNRESLARANCASAFSPSSCAKTRQDATREY
jgi:hypothetical protein